jgi:hypothetical protein
LFSVSSLIIATAFGRDDTAGCAGSQLSSWQFGQQLVRNF